MSEFGEHISRVLHSGGHAWTYELTGTAPYTILWRGQVQVEGWMASSYTMTIYGFEIEPPPLEVLDVNDARPSAVEEHPGFVTLQWRGRADAYYYLVQHFNGSTWDDLPPMLHGDGYGRGYYPYTTPWLDAAEDMASSDELFRVKIFDRLENEGGTIPFNLFIIRHPDPPETVVTWNAGAGQIEVNSA